MTPNSDRQREDDGPVDTRDAPADRDEVRSEDGHADGGDDGDDERKPEPPNDLGDLEPEVGTFDFLLGRAPGDVVREQMGKESLREMNAEATKEKEAVEIARREAILSGKH